MSKKKRLWLAIGAGGFIVVAGFIAIGVAEQSAEGRKLTQARRAASDLGVPLTASDLERGWPAVSKEDNAWTGYSQAYEEMRAPQDREDGRPSFKPTFLRALSSFRAWRRGAGSWIEEMARQNDGLGSILAEIDEASRKPIRWEKEWDHGLSVTLPETGQIVTLSRLVHADAAIAIEQGDVERALQRIALGVRIVRQLWEVPLLQAKVAGMHAAHDALAVAKWAVCARRVAPSDVRRIQEVIDPILSAPDLRPGLRHYVYAGMASVAMAESEDMMKDAGFTERDVRRSRHKEGLRESTEREWLEAGAAILSKWPENPEDTVAIEKAIGKDGQRMKDALSLYNRTFRDLFGGGDALFESELETLRAHVARVRLLKILFREIENPGLEAGVRLSELGLLGIDPFTGEPFAFTGRGGVFKIYSYGFNREDDGGTNARQEGVPLDIAVAYVDMTTGW